MQFLLKYLNLLDSIYNKRQSGHMANRGCHVNLSDCHFFVLLFNAMIKVDDITFHTFSGDRLLIQFVILRQQQRPNNEIRIPSSKRCFLYFMFRGITRFQYDLFWSSNFWRKSRYYLILLHITLEYCRPVRLTEYIILLLN